MKAIKWIGLLAVAIVYNYHDGNYAPPNYLLTARIFYVGNDVPGTFWEVQPDLPIANTVTSATLQAAIAAAVRSDATSRGLSVPAGNVWMPAWTTQ